MTWVGSVDQTGPAPVPQHTAAFVPTGDTPMKKYNRTFIVFWLSYFAGMAVLALVALLMACGPVPTSEHEPCPVDESPPDQGPEPDGVPETKFDIPAAPDYCDVFGETDPGFFITVDEDGPVISPTACQGLYASCYISGVGEVDMWCDFPCGATREMTVTMPDIPGLYKVTFTNPCE